MAAKNAATLRILNQKLRERELLKQYLCIVCGHMPQKEETLTAYLQKNESQNRVYISEAPQPGARTIRTRYRVLTEKEHFSLLEIDLLTGRTHQIRAHMAAVGHPLAGDGKYGANAVNKKIGFRYQALYSYRLQFLIFTQMPAFFLTSTKKNFRRKTFGFWIYSGNGNKPVLKNNTQ